MSKLSTVNKGAERLYGAAVRANAGSEYQPINFSMDTQLDNIGDVRQSVETLSRVVSNH